MSFKEISISGKRKRTEQERIAAEEKRQKALEEDSKMVTGIFKNIESPGGDVEFAYKVYKEDPIRVYHFNDGQKDTIPLGLAKHINNGTAYAERDYVKSADGTKQLYTFVKSKKQRYQFLSTEFM